METNFRVDETKRTVTATIKCYEGTFKGIAKCLPTDVFDIEIGKQIAYKRALLQLKKVDIQAFKQEYHELNEHLKNYEKLVIERDRLKRHIQHAKKRLSGLFREIETLSNESISQEKTVKTNTSNKLTGRYFNKNVVSDNGKRIKEQYVIVIEELSKFKSKVLVHEYMSFNDNFLKQASKRTYMDIISNDNIFNMQEITEEEYSKALDETDLDLSDINLSNLRDKLFDIFKF